MRVVFVTGGLASGKGTVCRLLGKRDASVFDLDEIAKEEQRSPALISALQAEFGHDITGDDGRIDRRLLAERAFATQEASRRLDAICWPPVHDRLMRLLTELKAELSEDALVVVEIPLLVEAQDAGLDFVGLADAIIAVEADEELRLSRAIKRGMSPVDARKRIAAQVSSERRRSFASVLFENNGSFKELETQVENWYASL